MNILPSSGYTENETCKIINQSLDDKFTPNFSQVGRTLMTATINAVDVDGQMMEIKPAISVSEELHIYKPLKVRAEGFIWNEMKQKLLISYFNHY